MRMNKIFVNIDYYPGKVVYDDFDSTINDPIDANSLLLKEDMIQVKYPLGYTLDIGHYSGIKKFIVYVIRDCNWEEPITKRKYKTLNNLRKGVLDCHKLICRSIKAENKSVEL